MTVALEAYPGFTFGCDPELFLLNEKGEAVSADRYLPGNKDNVYELKCGGAVHVDGTAAEFTIQPATSFKEFKSRVNAVKSEVLTMLPTGFTFSPDSVVVFSEEEWDRIPDEARALGCSPDFNAWTGEVNPVPDDPENPRMRTASGHLHIGWTEGADPSDIQHLANCRDLVKQLDWYLGGWSVKLDTDPRRRRLYGKAGAMRYKPYGVEYRVLSNFWLANDSRMQAVWDRLQTGIDRMRNGFMPDQALSFGRKFDFNEKLIQSINNTSPDPRLISDFKFPLFTINTL